MRLEVLHHMKSSRLALLLALVPLDQRAEEGSSANRVTVSFRSTFNVGARFSGVSGSGPASEPGPVGVTDIIRNYDDGYVRVDSEGNAEGLTWNWGYRDAEQVNTDGTLDFHSGSALGSSSISRAQDDPQLGFEIAWERQLIRTDRLRLGLKAAFGLMDVGIDESRSFRRDSEVVTDSYSLGGIIPPGDPGVPGYQYQGTFGGPGPLIGGAPSGRTLEIIPLGALTSARRTLESTLFHWKLGPWLEMPIGSRFAIFAGGGLAFGYADSVFRYREVTLLPTGVSLFESGERESGELALGGYMEAGLRWQISESWHASSSFEYQRMEGVTIKAGARSATLELKSTYSLLAGLGYSF